MNFIKVKTGKAFYMAELAETTRQIGVEQIQYFEKTYPYLNQTLPPCRMTENQRLKLLQRIKRVARYLDSYIYFLSIPIGISSLLGFIPIFGGVMSALLSLYQIWLSTTFGIPLWLFARLLFNLSVRFIFSLIPILGGLFAMFYKCNLYNYEELKNWLDNPTPEYVERVKLGQRRPSGAGSPPGEISWSKLSSDVTHLASQKLKKHQEYN